MTDLLPRTRLLSLTVMPKLRSSMISIGTGQRKTWLATLTEYIQSFDENVQYRGSDTF